ncbi:apolipoprotein L3-like [Canis lupus baileyi]|uniref:Apolipoprotein L3 n=1 Tax=Canis lupus familiaris TaxID=9615 RepID=J9PBH8_CANLF|nr:apolipoprotein L3-like isoform X1 [Canis lupus familiaris]XP_038535921.1 apolipoprotein L3-like isoform X1 [Canis lupus familiaris]XP_038535922.1 apolipoprotein L3-like isoform X1 [Canis lupus familiaris]XP_038535923.1 apolipoprotein L3-like isoform X1 [Canis lupus familiaris]XP_038535924.1 apolipoprotein L3-like isoform X1 [Canis lupus familiaris]XP_038535925.1 apolipoprotein L3-like isoform X1 [Canis lupus familiaris]XP_038535926.1 apolipoprotein L3-like isoform X1 [Canis lupus familiari|eukprot:XP_022280190.1 apolipoprotein L3 [Canis lupus familiaris]
MTSEGRELSPENKSFIEDAIEYFQDTVNREVLHFLLINHETWEKFVAETSLSREDADALREGLNDLEGDMDIEDEGQAREKFLNVFPQVKVELEGYIKRLRECADEVDQVHEGCTITNIVASSTGAATGPLGIHGLGLVPVIGGLSPETLVAGVGLGAASDATQVTTSIVEGSHESPATAETTLDKEEVVAKVLHENWSSISSLALDSMKVLARAARDIRNLRLGRFTCQPVVAAAGFLTANTALGLGWAQVKRVVRGSLRAIARGARVVGTASLGLFILMEAVSLVFKSGNLHEEAKTWSAESMREEAQELNRKLELLKEIYESLK